MLFANYHTHTARCRHADGEDRAYIEQAICAGMQVLGFADHNPWIFDGDYVSRSRMRPSDLDGYFSSLLDLKQEYARDITIYIGFETEYLPEHMEQLDALLQGYPVEYMLLGEHFMDIEPYGTYTGIPCNDEAEFRRYIDLCIEGMETGRFAGLAHPDLFHFTGDASVYYAEYRRLCEYLKSRDIPIEINQLGLADKRHYTSPAFLKIAKEVGNTAIIGVDAHTPAMLADAAMHKTCRALAEEYGLALIAQLPELPAVYL